MMVDVLGWLLCFVPESIWEPWNHVAQASLHRSLPRVETHIVWRRNEPRWPSGSSVVRFACLESGKPHSKQSLLGFIHPRRGRPRHRCGRGQGQFVKQREVGLCLGAARGLRKLDIFSEFDEPLDNMPDFAIAIEACYGSIFEVVVWPWRADSRTAPSDCDQCAPNLQQDLN